ncbi:MAG: DUF5119 domain-containing protein [Bacteroidaceae bacterium]|nr:DUF5119 domain-containing protein [Bacteroidaceae bacterium]
MSDIGLRILWDINWKAEWLYDWDEKNPAYGKIDYTKPELIKTTIYNLDSYSGKRYSSFYMLFDSTGGRIRLNSGSTYDMLFYNFGTEYIGFYQTDDLERYNAFTRTSNLTSYIRTRAENTFSTMPEDTKPYDVYNQPDEFFGTLVGNILINEDPTTYHKEYDKDGNVIYVYKIEAPLKPYSFIYLIQIIIKNNSDEKGQRIKGVNGLTVTGLSQGVELFSRKTLTNTISITTEEIKPMQPHTIDDPDNPGNNINVDILATRILTWGLPGIDPISEWEKIKDNPGTKAPELDKNYIGIGFTLRNGYSWNLTTDAITDQMHQKPTGGVITITVDASQIPQELLDKQQTTTGGGFNATVEDWSNEVNAEVTI